LTALFAAAILSIAQLPAQQPAGAPHQEHEQQPDPTNLKVLPKSSTGEQVHKIMHGWAAALGTHCDTCHTEDPNNLGPNGKPRLKFADDSKPEKAQARIMYTMMEEINKNYLAKIEAAAGPNEKEKPKPVTCGTCHRGHVKPPAYIPPPEALHQH
jgi:cytochrome c553